MSETAAWRCGGDGQSRSHKVQGVRERMEAAGARLLYLPPYSPDLNPIEKAFAKLKQLLLPSVCLQARVIAFEIAQTEDRQ